MALAIVVLCPFLDKAFTIDDPIFLRQAETALRDPLHPTAFEMVWSEIPRPVRMSQIMPSGPLMAYLLTPAVLLGGSERAAHFVQLLLLLLAIHEVAALSLRLGMDRRAASGAAMLVAASPAVIGMAGTAMPDVAAMSLAALGIGRTVAWVTGGRARDGALAFLGLALAPLARPHLFVVIGIAPILAWVSRRRPQPMWSFVLWAPVVFAPVAAFAVLSITHDPAGGATDTATSAARFSSLRHAASNALAFGTHWVLVLPLALPWVVIRGLEFWRTPWLAVALVACAGFAALTDRADAFWVAPLAALGLAALLDVLVEGGRRGDRVQLALSAWLLLALPVIPYIHLPSKYLVPAAPAAALIVCRASRGVGRDRGRAAIAVSVGLGASLGVLILRADAEFAGLARRIADEVVEPRIAGGQRVWFAGHWGFHWYAAEAGARPLTLEPPVAGDIVVVDLSAAGSQVLAAHPRRDRLAAVTEPAPAGTIMGRREGAGFYSNWWGYLPWSWRTDADERFEVWRFAGSSTREDRR